MERSISPLGPRTLGRTLSESMASFGPAAKAFGLPPIDWGDPKSFTFRRCKIDGAWRWEVGLNVGRLWTNLSSYKVSEYQPSLSAAREWAIDFADRHGFKAMEAKSAPRRSPRKPAPPLRLIVSAPTPSDGNGQ